ncbi:MAG: hypothetical protein LBS24_02615 [Clostridiales Family XIII bacterium]|nr:hypothetical protein [Clostridiales Family XIII bacterium]
MTYAIEKVIEKALTDSKFEGRLEGKLETAAAMIKRGVPLNVASECTGIPADELREHIAPVN